MVRIWIRGVWIKLRLHCSASVNSLDSKHKIFLIYITSSRKEQHWFGDGSQLPLYLHVPTYRNIWLQSITYQTWYFSSSWCTSAITSQGNRGLRNKNTIVHTAYSIISTVENTYQIQEWLTFAISIATACFINSIVIHFLKSHNINRTKSCYKA